jgi:hypothetical protein
MKLTAKREFVKALDLNFSKYAYYDYCGIYRYSKRKKTSEFFNGKVMKWEPADINIRELTVLWGDTEHDDIQMFSANNKEALIYRALVRAGYTENA